MGRARWISELTKIEMEKRGYRWADVEHYDARTRRSHDLLGIFDFLCFKGPLTIGLQVTDTNHVAEHVKKIEASPWRSVVLAAGWLILLWGWRRDGTLRELVDELSSPAALLAAIEP